jgi:hypothetical protein
MSIMTMTLNSFDWSLKRLEGILAKMKPILAKSALSAITQFQMISVRIGHF